MRLAYTIPAIAALFILCSCARTKPPAPVDRSAEKPLVENQNPAPDEIHLPAPDPQIQKWMTELAGLGRAKSESQIVAVAVQAREALYQKAFTKLHWVRQIIVFLIEIKAEGEEGWGRELTLLHYSKQYLQIDAADFGLALAPLLNSKNPRVAYIAGDMLDYCGIRDPDLDRSTDVYNVPEFRAMGSYLDRCKPGDPSWIIIQRLYLEDPNAALNSANSYYFSRDRNTWRQLRRSIREMMVLLLSHELASVEDTSQWDKKITSKLAELAGHPHWSVRVYALSIIQRGLRPFGKSNAWAADSDIPATLANDPNSLVSQWANSLKNRNVK